MTKTRYEELQDLTNNYGKETMIFYRKVKDIGPKIISEYIAYLGGPKSAANAVPPDGNFEPRGCYCGKAFDSHGQGTIYLDPIRMGVCTEIGNTSDRGATWVRTVLKFNPSGEGLRLTVGNRERQFHIGADPSNVIPEICEAIYQDAREAFSLELDEAQGRSRIGFTSERD